MQEEQLETPVVFIIFNRPELTQKVFNEIARIKPKQLYVIADGPRLTKEGERERCVQARSILEQVNWPCDFHKNYSDINLGCKKRISSGLDWVFERVSEAIILEDDCLPNASFFQFCQTLLERYRDNEMMAMISGSNFQYGQKRGAASYYYSHQYHIWGWATWRRAWRDFDANLSDWPIVREGKTLEQIYRTTVEVQYWQSIFQKMYDNQIDSWAYPWFYCNLKRSRLSIIPNANLVSNIGFGKNGTHTFYSLSPFANLKKSKLTFPLCHPETIAINQEADDFISKRMLTNSYARKIYTLLRHALPYQIVTSDNK